MPKYIVRVIRREVVVLAADVRINAASKKAARTTIQRRLHREDGIDDRLWCEEDSYYTDEPMTIKDVFLDTGY